MSTTFTVITLFALEPESFNPESDPAKHWRNASDGKLPDHLDAIERCPADDLGGLLPAFKAAGSQMPVRLTTEDFSADKIWLAPESASHGPFGSYNILDGQLSLYGTQTGGVLALRLRTQAVSVGGVAQLLRDTAFRKDKAAIDKRSLIQWAEELAKRVSLAEIQPIKLGQFHQIIMANQLADLLDLNYLVDDNVSRDDDWECSRIIATYLTSKDSARSLRTSLTNIKYPAEANSHRDIVTAITSHTSIIAANDTAFVNGVTLSAVQCLSTITRARFIRNVAYRTLSELRQLGPLNGGAAVGTQSRLLRLAATVRELKLEQSFALRAYIDIAALVPDERLSGYHRTLGAALRLPDASTLVDGMLTDLSAALETFRIETQVEETNVVEDRVRTVTWVSAGVAIIAVVGGLIFGFLGMNATPVGTGGSPWRSNYIIVYIVILIVVAGAGGLGLLGARRGRSRHSPDAELNL